MALTFRPSQWISLGPPSKPVVSLDLELSICGIFRGVSYTNILQDHGNGNFYPLLLQKWVVMEYNSHGLEYFLGPHELNEYF